MTGKRRGRSRFSGRDLGVRVATAKGRGTSSTLWLVRQLNDPYIAEAHRRGFRSRAAFKLIEIDEKYGLLKPGLRVVDLGAAPGGWTQFAVARIGAARGAGRIVAIDTKPFEPIEGATILIGDATAIEESENIVAALGGPADIVLSDLAAPATGHGGTDHLRSMALCESAHEIARRVLAPGGVLVVKTLTGGEETGLVAALKLNFATVRFFKPRSSRSESREIFVVATGFRGRNPAADQSTTA